jgi:hypothetical protein
MANSSPSALITDHGARVLLRLGGHIFSLTQPELRQILELPDGPLGLGITIDRDRLHFEFSADHRSATITAAQLRHRLAKRSVAAV